MSKWYRENGPGGQKEAAPKPAPPKEELPDVTPAGASTEEGEPMMAVGATIEEPTGVYKDIPFYGNPEDGFSAVVNGEEITSISKKGIKNAIKRALNKTDEGGDDDEPGDTDDTDA